MIIAVPYADGEIFRHFGPTQQFMLYQVENDTVISSRIADTNGSGHGALAAMLQNLNVDVLTCGGIGGGAQAALAEAGIRLYGGVWGEADTAVAGYLSGTLRYNPNVRCAHHVHACGEHGCGSHCQ